MNALSENSKVEVALQKEAASLLCYLPESDQKEILDYLLKYAEFQQFLKEENDADSTNI